MYVHMCLCIYVVLVSFTVLFVQGKQGEIKHVYRGSVFIQSRNLVENGGLIVAKTRHVELAGGTGMVSCWFFHVHTRTPADKHTHMRRHTHTITQTKTHSHTQTHKSKSKTKSLAAA